MRRLVLIALAVAALATAAAPASAGYDSLFKRWGSYFFGPAVPWQWFRAQAIAESALKPSAKSPAGALGLMQLMPGTSAEIAAALAVADLPLTPEFNVMAGIYYDRKLWAMWRAPRPLIDRISFMFASYNAGPGHILKAQSRAATAGKCNPNLWACTAARLPAITGRHSKETINYVARIKRLYSQRR